MQQRLSRCRIAVTLLPAKYVFDFEHTYGPRGAGYIECHHIVPLHVSGPVTTKLDDLALVCSNCHRMIHRSAPWLTPSELRKLVNVKRSS
ncbi:HNH endonuclease [Microbispora sp. NPDC049633]|uniref:HNH endonuclease n=1 Tax=Microbispora sp. NPDC049633 TaxID=3154355 RepID=UPI003416F6E2